MFSNISTSDASRHLDTFKKMVVDHSVLTQDETADLFEYLISTPEASCLCSAALAVMQYRGESEGEILGLCQVMSRRMKRISLSVDNAIDIGGTGGGRSTFNISTAAALIVAAAGVPVCKHGNYRVSSQSGSFDVLSALQLKIEKYTSPEFAKQIFENYGITFLSTRAYHDHPEFLITVRNQLGIRTGFNIIGPLLNPACVQFQVVGVSVAAEMPFMAEILINQGRKGFILAHGLDGIDEISPCAPTKIIEYREGVLQSYTLTPEDFGFSPLNQELLYGGPPEVNAKIVSCILNNELPDRLRVVLPTAAASLYICNAVSSLPEGVQLAHETIKCGKAAKLLSQLQAC